MQRTILLSVGFFSPKMESSPSLPPNRRHDLDALRAFAMLLGIALHASLSFAQGPWLVQDSVKSGWFGLLITAVHGFRMPLFFLLSGFFTAMLWRRRGLKALIHHRFRRVFLPLLLGMVTIGPAMHWIAGLALADGGNGGQLGGASGATNVWKASAEGDWDSVAQFIDDRVPIDTQDPKFGITPLSYAVLHGHRTVVRQLMDRGANVNTPNRDGGTALHTAAFLGRAEIAKTLLAAGADPNLKNERGETAVDGTRADWPTTLFVLRLTKVSIDEETLRRGREEIAQLLGAEGTNAGTPSKGGKLRGIWMFLTQVPVFHHLWFLWFLCWMVGGFAVWAWLADRAGWVAKPRRWITSPLRYLWLIPLTLIPALFMGRVLPNFGPDTSTALLPPLHLLAYYGIFYGFGAMYFDSQDEGSRMGKRWWLTLPFSVLIIYPAGLHATFEGVERWRFMAVVLQVIYVWAMSAGMIGLFRRFVSQERKWVRYLSDASYWMYVAHLPLVLAAQLWVRDWSMPATLKFLIVCGSVSLVLLVSYEYAVRYTWVGALLNGRKVRGAT